MKHLLLLLLISCAATAQQTKNVDFKTLDAGISFDVPNRKVMGTVKYTFDVLSKPDTIFIDAINMQFNDVKINGKKAKWVAGSTLLKLYNGYKKGKNTLEFTYTAQPKQTLYFVRDGDGTQIWTQGQGKYTSYWLPSFDDVNEKVIFNLSVTYDAGYTVLANGKLQEKKQVGNKITHRYAMDKPMSSYLAMLAVGKYNYYDATSASGTKLEFYLRPQDDDKFETTYRYSKQIFDFFEREIGVPYAWGLYRQVPVLDFLYAGMENTTSTIFSQDFVVDSIGFNDRTYINVNAHELAHQWFGDLITAESGTHHWLQEGFATYYALLAEQELFGDDHFYYEMYEIAERVQQASKNDTIPVMNDKASSLSFYQKGAWALHVLREGIGHEAFKKAVKTCLEKYSFKNVNTDEFLAEIHAVAPGYDTADFKKRWLQSGVFHIEEVLALLEKNKTMQQYLAVGELQGKPFAESKEQYLQIMQSDAFYAVKEEILFQIVKVPFADKAPLLRLAINSGDLRLRQAVARTLTTIPKEFTDEYWSLLNDKSYITREVAMNVLYKNFPDRRAELLDKTSGFVGFNDMNTRILWLTLAYSAKGYRDDYKPEIYAELQSYASPRYESGIRQNALSNLIYIAKPDPIVWENLVNATLHHKWQFVKFGKDNIRKLLKKEGYRSYFEALLPELQEAERDKLQQLLDEKQG
jgi:aminopeptidase N